MHCCVHTYAHTHVPSRARLARALTTRPTTVGASAGPCERGGGGTHRCFRLGQSAAAGSAASSVLPASLRADSAAGAGRLRPKPGRAPVGNARQPCVRGARPTADDRQRRRRRIQRRVVRPRRQARQRHAQQCSAGTVANAQRARRRRQAGRTVPPRACTGRATRGAPSPSWRRSTCRTPHARVRRAPAAHQRADVGTNGPKPCKGDRAYTCTHPHARDRRTDAFGAAIVP
jgi:hypothetical protein